MGCVVSRLEDDEEEVVAICKERKKLLKLSVQRRRTLSEAHAKYFQSMYAVAAAIKLFVARHSSPSSPFMITFPPPCGKPLETEERSIPKAIHGADGDCISCISSPMSSESSKNDKEREGESYKYFYMQMPSHSQSPGRDHVWDYFNPFDVIGPELMNAYVRSSEDDLRALREREGIPELEEARDDENEDDKEEDAANYGQINENEDEEKKLNVLDSPEKKRELLEALKDIMDHFVKACDSGNEVSRMLEVKNIDLQPEVEEVKEKSTKFIPALPWHTLSKTSSCKSLVVSHSKSVSTWNEYTNDLFDDYGGMKSGSHSQTLGRLYAWEKKLYEEVKAGDGFRKLYEKKRSRLRSQDASGEDDVSLDKTRASIKDLYARILVAIRSAESISKKIEKLRDDELELISVRVIYFSLSRTWETVSQSHETQNKIIFEVGSFACSSLGKFGNDSHRLATLQLEAELQNWRVCFTEYITSQKAYVEALHGWLTKCIFPEVEFDSRRRSSLLPPFTITGPPLLLILRDWLSSMERLPHRAVSYAIKGFSSDIRALWSHQGGEQRQKRRVDNLSKELDRKMRDARPFGIKLIEYKRNLDADPLIESDHLEILRRKLIAEKEKHQIYVQQTQTITLNGFQTGFAAVFENLAKFSTASLTMYNGLLARSGEEANQECLEDETCNDEKM